MNPDESPTVLVAFAEFLDLTGARAERVTELVELGWLPVAPASLSSGAPGGVEAFQLRRADVYKTRKVERLCDDFELSTLAGSIIVDLLERIEDLERRLRELER